MTKGWVLGFLFFCGSTLGLFADGVVIPSIAYPVPDIPEQQALIHFTNGVEKLVIQTSFTGQGTNFAWIVPLPAVPKIEPATSGLFPTLQFQFRPEVEHNVTAWFGGFIALYAFIRLLWKTRAGGSVTAVDWLSSIAFGCGLGFFFESPFTMVFLTMATLYAVDRVRQGKEGPLAIALMALLIFVMGGMLLPALSTAGSSITSANSVTVHDRQTVGSYETAVVSAQKADELMDWLKSNGFATPAEITPVVADYIKDGWVFAAARLARHESKGASAIHPLMFTFPTPKPVYPMRLTGVGNGNLKVALYVFGDKRAKAPNFTVSRCAQATYPATNNYYSDTIEKLYVGHPGLSNIVEKAAIATKLEATLTPAQMKQDVWLDWELFQAHQAVVYSARGAWITALNYIVPILVLGFLVQDFTRFQSWAGPTRLRKVRLNLLGITVISTLAIVILLPQVTVRMSKTRPQTLARLHDYQQKGLAFELAAIAATNQSLNISNWLSENMEIFLKTNNLKVGLNPYSGQPCKQEDSPGNFRIIARTNGFDYIWYDSLGFANKITYPNPNRD